MFVETFRVFRCMLSSIYQNFVDPSSVNGQGGRVLNRLIKATRGRGGEIAATDAMHCGARSAKDDVGAGQCIGPGHGALLTCTEPDVGVFMRKQLCVCGSRGLARWRRRCQVGRDNCVSMEGLCSMIDGSNGDTGTAADGLEVCGGVGQRRCNPYRTWQILVLAHRGMHLSGSLRLTTMR